MCQICFHKTNDKNVFLTYTETMLTSFFLLQRSICFFGKFPKNCFFKNDVNNLRTNTSKNA